jgi:hypothetical protein
MKLKREMSDEELREWYENHKAKQMEHHKRYNLKIRLLAKKALAKGIEVSEEEIDKALGL